MAENTPKTPTASASPVANRPGLAPQASGVVTGAATAAGASKPGQSGKNEAPAEAGAEGDVNSLAMNAEEEVVAEAAEGSGLFGGLASAVGGTGALAAGAGVAGLAALGGGGGGGASADDSASGSVGLGASGAGDSGAGAGDSGGNAANSADGSLTGEEGADTTTEEEKTEEEKKEEEKKAEEENTAEGGQFSEGAQMLTDGAPIEQIPEVGPSIEEAILSGGQQFDAASPASAGGGDPTAGLPIPAEISALTAPVMESLLGALPADAGSLPSVGDLSASPLNLDTGNGSGLSLDLASQSITISGIDPAIDGTVSADSLGGDTGGGTPSLADLQSTAEEGVGGILGSAPPELGGGGATAPDSGGISLDAPASGISSAADMGGGVIDTSALGGGLG